MSIKKYIVLLSVVFVCISCSVTVSAMTQQEADEYNNLYYPQSVYNGGINTTPQESTQTAYVEPATGSTHINVTDLSLPGANGFDLNIARSYNSTDAALFEAYLKETDIPYEAPYYMIKGSKRIYRLYTDNSWDSTPYYNICLTPDFMTYHDSKTDVWMVTNSSKYEYAYIESPAKSKLFSSYADAQEVVNYLNTTSNEIDATFPYSNTVDYEVDYYDFQIVTVWKTEYYTDYTDGLIDDTATERYSKLGAGWEFDFPYVETRYGYDDEYEYLHFGNKGTWLIDFSDGGINNLAGYSLNDIKLVTDTSITHDGMRSRYRLDEKNGTKHYFGNDGRLLIQQDRFGNQIKFYCDTESYLNVWGNWKNYPYIKKIVDTLGREVVFTFESDTSGNKTMFMTITDPSDTLNPKIFEYYLDKLSNSEIGILGYDECDDSEGDEWVLYNVTDPEGRTYRYRYDYLKTKFAFLDRNSTFYYDYYDIRNSTLGNSYIDSDNFEEFNGIHNTYALLKSASRNGDKSYYFKYAPFAKNCTPNGSMMFYKAYKSYEETAYSYSGSDSNINEKLYNYDINEVGEYDGYIGYKRDDRIGSNYNYEVQVTDSNLPTDKSSFDIYKYTYMGANNEKTILLTKLTNQGTDHKIITDYTYNENTKLMTTTVCKNYSVNDNSQYMTVSNAYTYDTANYGDVISETPNGNADRATTYTYDSVYHFPLSKTYKIDSTKTLKTEYVKTSDGKSIGTINIYENNVLKNKIQYNHDEYGNIINQKQYFDNMTDYIEIQYVYENGSNLISETVKQVVDNNNLATDVTTSMTFDYWGNPITKTDANGNITSCTYDKNNRVTGLTNPDGSTKTYNYSSWYTRETDELGNIIRTYYTNGKDVEQIYYQSLGVDYNYCYYDPFGNLETEVIYSDIDDADGDQIPQSITKYAYDTMQRPTSKSVYNNDNTLTYKETYSYDVTCNYQKKTTTIVGDSNTPSIVTSEYTDVYGNKIKTEAGNDVETYTTDYAGNILTIKSARANAENWPDSYTSKIDYNYQGKPIKETNVLGNFTRIEYDALGQKIKTYDENGYATEYIYDKLGRVIQQKLPFEESNGTVSYSIKKIWYDNNGNIVKEQTNTNATGETESFSEMLYEYNNRNKLVKTTSNDGETSNYTQKYYDVKGNLLRVYTGLSAPLTISGLDNVSGEDTNYAVQQYGYDALSRVTSVTDALGKTDTNVYDLASGLLLSSTDRNGQTVNYNYNAIGKQTSKSLSDGTNNEITTYGLTGNIVAIQNSVATINYTYDNKGNITTESNSANGTNKSYTYDSDGNRISFILEKNGDTEQSLSYSFDKLGRLISVSESGSVIASYSYDNKGNRVQTVTNGEITGYTYNIANMLVSQQTGSTLNEQYTYYLNGNQRTKTSNGVTTTYAYDKMNRLVVENDTEYSFDDFGNRLAMVNDEQNVSYSYDLNNRLTQSLNVTENATKQTRYFYDDNGNQITKAVQTGHSHVDGTTGDYTISDVSDENVALYEYNCYNQLVGADTNEAVSTYTYAPDGLRQSKTVGGNTITFVYDNANVIEEISTDETNKYYRGYEIIKNDDNLFYLYNGQGDVSVLTNADGSIIANYTFDAYGKQSEENTTYNPFGYRGEYTDSETTLVYLRARMYDPETGRFVNEDPAKDNLNWYIYCDGDPINRIDPNGTWWLTDFIREAFQANLEMQMAQDRATDEMQKNIQREIWKVGAQKYLREKKGFLTSAWMLEHSLQDYPDDIWRGNYSNIAYLVNNDSSYLTALDKAIKSSKNKKISTYLEDIAFVSGDLYYSIHAATIYVDGYKQNNGKWLIHATLTDTYDFTVIQSLMSDGKFSKEIGLGTIANDAAVVSQFLGAINEYDVTVDFYTTR